MSNPQYPGDPQNPYTNDPQAANQWEAQPQANSSWEQSQPTGNVWNQQATNAWGQQPAAPQGGFQPPVNTNDAKGFLGALFDFNFANYITNKVIKVVYIISTAVVAISLLILLITAFQTGNALSIVLAILLLPIIGILMLVWVRLSLEVVHAIIRISEDVHERLPRA